MPATITPYAHAWKIIHASGVNLATTPIKIALITNGYTFSAAHTVFAPASGDASDPAFNEVADGSGYTTGGVTLAGGAGYTDHISYDNARWQNLTKTFRYGIFYFPGSVGGLDDPLIACALFDDTPADTVVSASNWAVVFDAVRGLFYDPAQL